MDLDTLHHTASRLLGDARAQFHKMPGSAILQRYIQSSYQNDPVRSAVELFLVLFFLRYILASSYSTQASKIVPLSEEVSEMFIGNHPRRMGRPSSGGWKGLG
jgi:serine palmitoyltransferase